MFVAIFMHESMKGRPSSLVTRRACTAAVLGGDAISFLSSDFSLIHLKIHTYRGSTSVHCLILKLLVDQRSDTRYDYY